jgi:multiple sugar transport system ATP-binding protein
VNLFVAGFIGSPSMNFLPARVAGDALSLPIADLPLTDELRSVAAGHDLLIAGLRPEHFEDLEMVPEDHRPLGVSFQATIDVVEWLGNEQYAYIPFDVEPAIQSTLADLAQEMDSEQMRTQLVVNVDTASRIAPRRPADLWLDPRGLHLFDPHTGANLTLPAP